MKVSKYEEEPLLDFIDTIESRGMIEMEGVWVKATVILDVKKETEKAYLGNVEVLAGNDSVYEEEDTWIPKSMTSNVWWICIVKFGHDGKVSNKRFEVNDYY